MASQYSLPMKKNDFLTEHIAGIDQSYEYSLFNNGTGTPKEYPSNGNTIGLKSYEVNQDGEHTAVGENTDEIVLASYDVQTSTFKAEEFVFQISMSAKFADPAIVADAINQAASMNAKRFEQDLMMSYWANRSSVAEYGKPYEAPAATFTTAEELYKHLAATALTVASKMSGKKEVNIYVCEVYETLLKEEITSGSDKTWLLKLEELSYIGGVQILPATLYTFDETGEVIPTSVVIFINPEAAMVAHSGLPATSSLPNDNISSRGETIKHEFVRGRVVGIPTIAKGIIVQNITEGTAPLSIDGASVSGSSIESFSMPFNRVGEVKEFYNSLKAKAKDLSDNIKQMKKDGKDCVAEEQQLADFKEKGEIVFNYAKDLEKLFKESEFSSVEDFEKFESYVKSIYEAFDKIKEVM